ncbi:unnamed protein product [Adineta ricciae]|uniref:Uncharacterized protein n=1 Tax=Adineta ricciae TaxID=249248 RepID=A0A813MQM1_ADIRI|nr:unnamed protein product [Adineta ricciae]CAF0993083.1 unnamed protein product [Adineta ricciae]
MRVLHYFLVLSLVPYLTASFSPYGILRNASIKLPFDLNNDTGYTIETVSCNQCLCHAAHNPVVALFTCIRHEMSNFTCQMYYFIPKRDEIEYPNYDADVYLMRPNSTFEEKDDCCNTTMLIEEITRMLQNTSISTEEFLTLSEGENNTILAVTSCSKLEQNALLRFNRFTGENIFVEHTSSLLSAGYYKERYYFGTIAKNIGVYNSSMRPRLCLVDTSVEIRTIRFLKKTQKMLAGASGSGIYLCDIVPNSGILNNCTIIPNIAPGEELHAIGVAQDEMAFYVGWNADGQDIHLYRRQPNDTWVTDASGKIDHSAPTTDLVVDNCQRIWAVEPRSDRIRIYHRNNTLLGEMNVGGTNLFNLMIMENYTIFITHQSADGLRAIRPSLNCRPVP